MTKRLMRKLKWVSLSETTMQRDYVQKGPMPMVLMKNRIVQIHHLKDY